MGEDCRAYRESFVDACLVGAAPEARAWLRRLQEAIDEVVAPNAMRTDREQRYPSESVCVLRQIGAFGVNAPLEAGGLGFGNAMAALAIESVASACASTAAILMFHAQVTRRVIQFGTSRQQEEDLPLLATGQWLASSAWTEAAAGADKSQISTRVDGVAGQRTVTGEKTFCTGLEGASLIHVLVSARRPDETMAPAFIRVLRGSSGVAVTDIYSLLGLRGSSTGTLRLEATPVEEADFVGEIGQGMKLLQANHEVLLNPGLLALGLARAAYEDAKCVARGLPEGMRDLTGFQNVRFVLAEMEITLGTLYSYAAHAVHHSHAGRAEAHMECNKFKAYASRTAARVTESAMELLGSRGFTTALPVERYFRDTRATLAMGPSNELIKERVAGQILAETARGRLQ